MTHCSPKKLSLVCACLLLGGCHLSTNSAATPQPLPQPSTFQSQTLCTNLAPSFRRTGKLGINVLKDGKREAFSAFYDWSQENERFSLWLSGALGASAQLSYDGQVATLIANQQSQSDKNPQLLLSKALGIDAPMDSLALWVLGKCTPNQPHTLDNQSRLSHASQGNWSAEFFYDNDSEPSRLVLTHKDGHRLVMTLQKP